MANKKGKIFLFVTCLILIVASVFTLVACASKVINVKFMIKEDGRWQEYKTVAAVDGTVALPASPETYGYNFAGWCTDEEGKNAFDNKNVKESITVYASMTKKEINVSITDKDGNTTVTENVELLSIDALLQQKKQEAGDNELTFDGWYTTADFTDKYTTESETETVYGRVVAEVTFDNGYVGETPLVKIVAPGQKVSQPTIAEIKKPYMAEEDIFYLNADGTDFVFDNAITKNTKVTVMWKTPYFEYQLLKGSTEKCEIVGIEQSKISEVKNFPVVSFPSKATVKNGDANVVANVVNVDAIDVASLSNVRQVIFGNGIKYISNLKAEDVSKIEVITLPNTLEVLEDSFNGLTNLKSVTLPDTLQVVIDCFWKDYKYSQVARGNSYDFDIVIPEAVENAVLVPASLTFKNTKFKVNTDKNIVYKVDGAEKTLVSITQGNVVNGELVLPNDITSIQVGAIKGIDACDYIYIPASFKTVSYNLERSTFPDYTGSYLTEKAYVNNPRNHNMSVEAFAVIGNIKAYDGIILEGKTQYDNNWGYYAFCNSVSENYTNGRLAFTGEVADSSAVNVTLFATNTMVEDSLKKITFSIAKNTVFVKADIEAKILSEVFEGKNIKITSITQFGKEYKFDAKKCNQYIDVKYEFDTAGSVLTNKKSDGTLEITGFDKTKATEIASGRYLVVVPEEINGVKITSIKAGAFKNNIEIAEIYISNSVKEIGDEAFMNTINLQKVVVAEGGLEIIGSAAFLNAGAVLDDSTNTYKVNPKLAYLPKHTVPNSQGSVRGLWMQIPLSKLTNIKPYAFKTPAIQTFVPVASEAQGEANDATITRVSYEGGYKSMIRADVKVGAYYYSDSFFNEIVKYVGQEVKQGMPGLNNGEGGFTSGPLSPKTPVNVTVADVQLVAIAGGFGSTGSDYFVGKSRNLDSSGVYAANQFYAIRYEVMEGSVYYLNGYINDKVTPQGEVQYSSNVNFHNIVLANVSKIHANAFTDIQAIKAGPSTVKAEDRLLIHNFKHDEWLDLSKVRNQDSSIFEEGWYNGKANVDNTFMATLKSNNPDNEVQVG